MNGAVEAAVKQVRSRMKTMKICMERQIGEIIPSRHTFTALLVAHCAAVIRFRVQGIDSKTPHEQARMRPFSSCLVCFAEKVWLKDHAKEKRGDEHKWPQGLFLGMCSMTG